MSTRGYLQEIIAKHTELGNVSLVARKLNLSRSTVYRWLKRGIDLKTPLEVVESVSKVVKH